MFSHERPDESDDRNQSSHVLGPTHPFTIPCLSLSRFPHNFPQHTCLNTVTASSREQLGWSWSPLQDQVTSASAGPQLPEQVGQRGTEPPKGWLCDSQGEKGVQEKGADLVLRLRSRGATGTRSKPYLPASFCSRSSSSN